MNYNKIIELLYKCNLRDELFYDEPVLAIIREELERSVKVFLSDFPGMSLYAVKCNPHPLLIESIISAGINNFDTASLEEIKLIKSINDTAQCYFNHPVKSRKAIQEAFHKYGVTHFVVDSMEEWMKINSEIPTNNIIIQLRLNIPSGSKSYDFSSKFGMEIEELCLLAKQISTQNVDWAISFHVGSQCESPSAFVQALQKSKDIIKIIGCKPKYINVGGGFPAYYPELILPKLQEYFSEIRGAKIKFNLPQLICEPGRAIVCHAGVLIVKIIARKGNKLYLNDGVYGAFGEINYAKFKLKTIGFSKTRRLSNKLSEYQIFGPTCDSYDALDQPFFISENVGEGDWIMVLDMGAYSTSLSTNFNGFQSKNVALI